LLKQNPEMKTDYYFRLKLYILAFSVIFISWRIIHVPLYDYQKGRDSVHGDGYSDKNAHSTARYILDYGFLKSCLLPVWDYNGDPSDTTIGVYTHYPALPDVLAGVYAKIFRTDDDRILRIIPLILAIIWFYLLYNVFGKILKNKPKAFLSASILILSNYFLAWGDNLHKHLYEELLKLIFVYGLYRYYETERKNKLLLLGLCLVFITAVNISFEPVIYLAIVAIGFSWIYTRKIITYEVIILGLSALLGLGLHALQNYYYFGSWQVVWSDMKGAFLLRTVGQETAGTAIAEKSMSIADVIKLPIDIVNRIERFYLIPGWAFIIIAYLGMKEIKKESLHTFQIAIVLLIASLTWFVVMTQHGFIHIFTTRQLGIFYGLVIGYGLFAYWEKYKEARKAKKAWVLALHYVFMAYILVMALSQQVFDLYLKNGFFYPYFGK
jgi:hypothetical protein